jgi:hypothetical protein
MDMWDMEEQATEEKKLIRPNEKRLTLSEAG